MHHGPPLRLYFVGLGCTFVGAWLTSVSGSLIPLALGGAASVMCTVALVKSLWRRGKRGRSDS